MIGVHDLHGAYVITTASRSSDGRSLLTVGRSIPRKAPIHPICIVYSLINRQDCRLKHRGQRLAWLPG
jgi:hypothetical protein